MNVCASDFRTLVTAALLSGCRYGELTALTVGNFNPDSGTIRIPISKSGKPRHVVLTQEGRDFFVAAIGGRAGSTRLLVSKNGRPWAKSEQQRPIVAACAAAQIDPPVNLRAWSRNTMAICPRGMSLTQFGQHLAASVSSSR